MAEIPSEIRAGLERLADAVDTLAGVVATAAATEHSEDYGDQRNMGAVFYADAKDRFSDVLRKMEPKEQESIREYIQALLKQPKGKAK